MGAALDYIEGLRLNPAWWQVYETWSRDDSDFAVLAIWDGAGHEQQQLIEVGPSGVRWIPLRIFRSNGRDASRRGLCIWHNFDEVDSEAIDEHNRAVLAAQEAS